MNTRWTLPENLEAAACAHGERVFFRLGEHALTYAETRDEVAALAGQLHAWGAREGDLLAVDLPNCSDFVFLLFAAAELQVTLLPLNRRLPAAKKADLLADYRVRAVIDEAALGKTQSRAASVSARAEIAPPLSEQPAPSHDARIGDAPDPDRPLVCLLTSGTTGRPKAAALSQRNLIGAAVASNQALEAHPEDTWQLVLPLFHVGGLQIIARCLLAGAGFILYERFEPARVLSDAQTFSATHISVVDRILQDLITQDLSTVQDYRAILLGGGPLNPYTIAQASGCRVYTSYGMTETSAQIAAGLASEYDARGMAPLPGYTIEIAQANDEGVGEIRVAGPGVFAGYLAPGALDTSRLRDGFFSTGDRGCMRDGRLFVHERTGDLFVSGGENVYPREIEREIAALPDVAEVAVIGVPSPAWGRRPIAFVTGDGLQPQRLREQLRARLSGFQLPDHVLVLETLPSTAIGKVDRMRLAELFEQRIEITAVNLYRIKQPLATPFKTSQGVMRERESVIVEVVDHAGRAGYGEVVAFSTPWYTRETVEGAIRVIAQQLAPALIGRVVLHPREVFSVFANVPDNLMAKGGIEPACWDLYGRVVGASFRELIGASDAPAQAGVSLGMMPLAETFGAIDGYLAKGYRRVKLKIEPGDDVDRVGAVRARYPDLMLMVDANRAYTAADVDVFRQLDELGLVCVEEPIQAASLEEIAAFQQHIATPICIDESIETEADLARVLAQPELRNINLKIGKFGGVAPSLRLYEHCRAAGIDLWLGGMYETGVSKYLHAMFETLAGFDIPGDISESRRYFERDIVIPQVTVENGNVVLPDGPGLGFALDFERVAEILIERIEVRRDGYERYPA